MAFLEIKDLKVNYVTYEGSKIVLDIKDISIEKGTTYGIVGESGYGKTVLALAVLRLLRCPPGEIAGGKILLDGEDLLKKTGRQMEREVRGKRIAMIFQDPMSTLNPVFTVGRQLTQVIMRNKGMNKKDAEREGIKMLETVKLADAGATMLKYPHQLSGGQRQRVIIALALACGAELLIADEPTRNLDVTIQASILKLLNDLKNELHITVLFIANNLSLVSAFCDRVGILYKGRIIEQGDTERLISSPREAYTKLLIEAVREKTAGAAASKTDQVILKVENLKKYFVVNNDIKKQKKLRLKAVDDVSFELKKGEVLGIVGESGCGKSTLVNTILKLFEPTSGSVFFEGKDIYHLDGKSIGNIRKDIQIVFQDPYWSLNPRWLVKDIIAEPIDVHEKLHVAEKLLRVKKLLKMVGMEEEAAFRYPHEFSGGERQRIAIARALASEPKLVVLDEPTSSIDVFSQAQILELLRNLKEEFDLTNILISHDLGVVGQMSNKIAVMYLGKIVEFGAAQEVLQNAKHPYTRALFQSIPKLGSSGVGSLNTLEGSIPSPINPPAGCRFHTRCASALPCCAEREPRKVWMSGAHYVLCRLYEEEEKYAEANN